MRFAIFPVHLSTVLRLPRKSDAKSYEVLHLSRKIISKPEDLMLQNATPLRKSAPWPPNISDEHVFCIAPATRNASLKILFKCPTPAIAFGNATKPSRFAHFWQGAQSLAPATRKHIWTSKSAPYPSVFFALLTSKCASRHKSVHFFHISTSKSGPELLCFVHFDFKMCFAPQRRVLFRHLNFQKWSGVDVFCTFWLANLLRATRACNFSSLIWPDGSAPVALASLLFDPPEPQLEKHSVSRLSYLFAHLHLLSSDFLFSDLLSSTLLFSLPLPISAFHLSILSEVLFLNFLRLDVKTSINNHRNSNARKKGSRRDRNFRRGFPGECEMRGGGDL